MPVLQNVLCPTPEEARCVPRGDLVLAHCPACDFITNVAFDADRMHYGEDYENLQACSAFFEEYVDELVDRLVSAGLRQKNVVEVGCGTGYFLRKLCERGGNRGTGFDTAYRGPDEVGDVRFVRDVFDARQAGIAADAVLCRHVIEHVPDPLALLQSVRAALTASPDAQVVFETPAVEWILEHVVSHDLFYEHCSYFSEGSIAYAFGRAGFAPERIERLFGGQYLWVEARPASADTAAPPGARLGGVVEQFRAEDASALARASSRLSELVGDGAVAVWGVGAKGVTFLNLVDGDAEHVCCAVDVNPRKQGQFVAGTGHPIVGPEALTERGVGAVLLMNPNYLDECQRLADKHGAEVRFVTQETGWA